MSDPAPTTIGPWRRHSRGLVYENAWITVWHDIVTRPDGSAGIYGVVHYANLAAGVVVLDESDRVLLVGQHRYTLDAMSWEIPEGGVAPGEEATEGIRRELREETGVEATDWRELARVHLSNSVSDEAAIIYAATAETIGAASPEPTEQIEVRWVPFDEALAMTFDGRITDVMSVVGIQRVALERASRPGGNTRMTTTGLTVLRVFIGPDGRGGNPLGVFLDGAAIPQDRRQDVAFELNFSETVFVDDREQGRVRIMTPARELPFAGHPSVGTSWLLHETGTPIAVLRPPAGEVGVRREPDRTWITADPAWVAHAFRFLELATPADVEAYAQPRMGEPGVYVWSWIDEAAGEIRSRSFPTDFGIAEDEATGLAAVIMGGELRRPLTIRQGVGSEMLVRPQADGMVEIGGRVELVERRSFEVPQ